MKNPLPDHGRHSIRLQDYDYSQPGAYFITVCSYLRKFIFGEVSGGEMRLNQAGQIVWDVWNSLPDHYLQIELGAAVVMPNHFHGIIYIHDNFALQAIGVGAIHELPLRPDQPSEWCIKRRKMTLPIVVGYFKMNTARRINDLRGTPGLPVWQRNYYEHIIRGERDLQTITDYIETNPQRWEKDKYYIPISAQSAP